MKEPIYRTPEIDALHTALLAVDHGDITADAISSIRCRMLMVHSHRGLGNEWKRQYSLALARSVQRHGCTFDPEVVDIGIDILWNYFQRLHEQLKQHDKVLQEHRQEIMVAVLELAQHGAMLSQQKFQSVEKSASDPSDRFKTIRGIDSPFTVSLVEDGSVCIQADPKLLDACRRMKEALIMANSNCPALASMEYIVESMFDIFCDYVETNSHT